MMTDVRCSVLGGSCSWVGRIEMPEQPQVAVRGPLLLARGARSSQSGSGAVARLIPTLRVRCGAPTPAIQVVSSPELPASLNHTNIATILVSKKGCPFDRCAISLTLPASHRRRWLKSPCSWPRLTRESSRLPRLHDPWPNGTATAKFRISYEEAPQRIGAPRSLGTSPRYRCTHLFCDPPAGRTP